MNGYAILADIISVVHFGYILYVIFGQLGVMIGWPLGWRWIRNPWFRLSHLVMILIVALEAYIEFKCPLTTWETELRVLAGQRDPALGESPGFIADLIASVMFFDSRWDPVVNACYYIFAGIVVATVFLVPPRFRRAAASPAPSEPPKPVAEGAFTANDPR